MHEEHSIIPDWLTKASASGSLELRVIIMRLKDVMVKYHSINGHRQRHRAKLFLSDPKALIWHTAQNVQARTGGLTKQHSMTKHKVTWWLLPQLIPSDQSLPAQPATALLLLPEKFQMTSDVL
jgi:hypothetical protein